MFLCQEGSKNKLIQKNPPVNMQHTYKAHYVLPILHSHLKIHMKANFKLLLISSNLEEIHMIMCERERTW